MPGPRIKCAFDSEQFSGRSHAPGLAADRIQDPRGPEPSILREQAPPFGGVIPRSDAKIASPIQ